MRYSLLFSNGCGTAICNDSYVNDNETGVDCGGADCDPCDLCTEVNISITLDDYPQESVWALTDQSSGEPIIVNGPFYESLGITMTANFCLTDGCYYYEIFDLFGDESCCSSGNGSYSVTSEFAELLAIGGEFENSELTSFCIEKSYRFQGPGLDWNASNNWDKGLVPPIDFDGPIYIESNCLTDNLDPYNFYSGLIVKNGVTLTIR